MGKQVYLAWTQPKVPSYTYMFMLEAMTYKVMLVTSDPVHTEDLEVQAWTNQHDRFTALGEWHPIELSYICSPSDNEHLFGTSEVITSNCDFNFTFRFKQKSDADWTWSHGWQDNGFTHVEPPRDNDKWTQGPNYDHIQGAVHLGNFIAATNASQCGFTHVLNVADNLDMVYPPNTVCYRKVPIMDGAHNPILDHCVKEAVTWLDDVDHQGNKVLVNCRAGIGRAGSIAVAYVFKKNPQMSFWDAYHYVYARRFVYMHRHLEGTCYRLFRSDT